MTIPQSTLVLMTAIAASYTFVVFAPGFPTSFVEIGSLLGLLGALLLWWQYLIGFRGLVAKFIPDVVWLNAMHQRMGKYGYLQILLHPVVIVLAYQQDIGFWLQLETPFDLFVKFGTAAFMLLTMIWLTSALFRKKLQFRTWKLIHFISYAILPLVLIHSYNVGTQIQSTPVLKLFWQVLIGAYILVLVYRLVYQLGFTRSKYTLVGKTKITSDVYRFDFIHTTGKKLAPQPGQFIYIQLQVFGETHPYTISHFDSSTGMISISAKQFGPFSKALTSLEPDTVVTLDGPYGVFTQEMFESKTPVFIAGGIGITPLLSNLDRISPSQPAYLFYANKSVADIAYENELNAHPGLTTVHVLNVEKASGYESGFVTADLIKSKVAGEMQNLHYFICGPAPMMNAVTAQLKAAGVPKSQILTEKFSL